MDSTLALLVVAKTFDLLGVSRDEDQGADHARLRHHAGTRPTPTR
ncbi:MAG: hypothetical protein QM749_16355 [Aquabacterium sp.]